VEQGALDVLFIHVTKPRDISFTKDQNLANEEACNSMDAYVMPSLRSSSPSGPRSTFDKSKTCLSIRFSSNFFQTGNEAKCRESNILE
jgi:hypothetical protein